MVYITITVYEDVNNIDNIDNIDEFDDVDKSDNNDNVDDVDNMIKLSIAIAAGRNLAIFGFHTMKMSHYFSVLDTLWNLGLY